MIKRFEVVGRISGLVGLGIMIGSTTPNEVEGLIFGAVIVVISFLVVIVARDLR